MATDTLNMSTRPVPNTRTDMVHERRWTPLVWVQGASMEPTIRSGDLLVTRPAWRNIRRGEVVLLTHTSAARPLVKRVIGVPGDLVELEAGRLSVNGSSTDGRPHLAGALVRTWRVPEHHYFVVGDNALASTDSRSWDDPFIPWADLRGVVLRRDRGSRLP